MQITASSSLRSLGDELRMREELLESWEGMDHDNIY